jgi:hypothetical protein
MTRIQLAHKIGYAIALIILTVSIIGLFSLGLSDDPKEVKNKMLIVFMISIAIGYFIILIVNTDKKSQAN